MSSDIYCIIYTYKYMYDVYTAYNLYSIYTNMIQIHICIICASYILYIGIIYIHIYIYIGIISYTYIYIYINI